MSESTPPFFFFRSGTPRFVSEFFFVENQFRVEFL